MNGVCTAMITPFLKDGKSVDFEMFKQQIDFQLDAGIKTLVFLGTTGESSTLSEKEKIQIAKFVIKYVNKRAKVVIGTGGNCTSKVVELSKKMQTLGADALLIVTPYYNKTTQKGLIEHYTSIADAVDIPIILYNVPGRTGVNMLPQTVKVLSKHKNICAIKEASGNIEQILELSLLINENFSLLSGDDSLFYSFLSCGGSGVISVASNIIPEQMLEIYDEWNNKNIEKSFKKQQILREFIKNLFIEVNPIPIKTIMSFCELDSGEVRLPLTSMEKANEKILTDSFMKLLNSMQSK